MKRFENIVQSDIEPSTNSLWIKDGVQYYFSNGSWKPLSSSGDDADREELENKVDSLDKEMGEVKNSISKLNSSQKIVELQIGNSTEVKESNLKTLQDIQTLDHSFSVDIDYGYGTGSWLPDTGGSATIFTSEGHAVFYTITPDGSVTKADEYTLGQSATTFTDGLMSKEDKTKLDTLIQIPSGGSEGQVLKKSSTGVEWGTDNNSNTTYTFSSGAQGSFTVTPLGGVAQTITVGVPTKVSELENDSKFVTEAVLTNKQDVISDLATIRAKANSALQVVPAATTTSLGGITQISSPAELSGNAELAVVIARVNTIITGLISSGVFKGPES